MSRHVRVAALPDEGYSTNCTATLTNNTCLDEIGRFEHLTWTLYAFSLAKLSHTFVHIKDRNVSGDVWRKLYEAE